MPSIRSPLGRPIPPTRRAGRRSLPVVAVAAILLASSSAARAAEDDPRRWGIGLETGALRISRNDVRVAGDTGTRFDMNELTGADAGPFARVHLRWRLDERHSLRVVLAPLSVSGSGTLRRDTTFAGETFAAGSTDGTYRFNAYKLTYRYAVPARGAWRWGIGFTGIVRDARIELRQGARTAEKSNVGFVPTLHLSGDRRLSERWTVGLDFDGLAGGPGRLFDLAATLRYDLGGDWRVGVGYRTLEGGADTDEVFNFAWLNHAVLDIRYGF